MGSQEPAAPTPAAEETPAEAKAPETKPTEPKPSEARPTKEKTLGAKPSEEFRSSLTALAEEMERTAGIVRKGHFLAAEGWEKWNLFFGLASVVLGVVGGATSVVVFGNLNLAGTFATLTGVLGAANSFLKPADRVDKHKASGDDWSILRGQAAELCQLKMNVANAEDTDLDNAYVALLKQKEDITRTSPIISTRTYNQATDEQKKEKEMKLVQDAIFHDADLTKLMQSKGFTVDKDGIRPKDSRP